MVQRTRIKLKDLEIKPISIQWMSCSTFFRQQSINCRPVPARVNNLKFYSKCLMMHTTKQLRLLQWNGQGLTTISSSKQLELFLHQNQIDVALLNETFCKDIHKLYLAGYITHRHDRIDGAKGGVAIAIKSSIRHSLLPPYNTKKIENVSISVNINRRNVIFTSAYSPKYYNSFESELLYQEKQIV